ncbi:hypothetical protein Gogos_021918 [Gossypium gossypioides]|uniref:DUF7745 domain-containing protein n=1 Tax=Gossypium gossypioides TaxID=34282 RepID=A0A7J9D0L9_GOSGO|nr:hypothetical protein [Gossypium gossypioides]
MGEGRFIGCAQLLLTWFHSHFWKVDKVSYRVFLENYSPLKEIVATSRRDDISVEKWMVILQNLQEEVIEWRAPWLLSDEILYKCGNFDWVPLLGIWGAVGYAPLLVLRQYRSRQFIPVTQGIADCEFSYSDDGYRKKIQEISSAWKQTHRMKRKAKGKGRVKGQGDRVGKISSLVSKSKLYNRIESKLEQDRRNEEKNRRVRNGNADMLSVKYELESDQGQELALLLRKIRILSNREKLYL